MKLLVLALLSQAGPLASAAGDLVIGCYFTNWAQHRPDEVRYLPKNIDAALCTHAYFAFANIDLDVLSITNFEANDFMSEGENKPVNFSVLGLFKNTIVGKKAKAKSVLNKPGHFCRFPQAFIFLRLLFRTSTKSSVS